MKDPVTAYRISLLHPKVIQQFTDFVNELEAVTGLTFRVVQGLRTFAEQTAIYNQGRTTPGKIVTYSPAGASFHNYGVSCDICPFKLNSTTELDWGFNFHTIRDMAIANGLQPGIDFPHPDSDHFENKFGLGWRDMLHKYTIKDFIPGTQFIQIP